MAWEVTTQEVMEEAKLNSARVMPPTFKLMRDILRENSSLDLDDLCVPEEVLADAVYYYSRNGGFRKILPMETILV